MQVALAVGVLVLAFAALANSAPKDAVKVGEGAKAIMLQQVENRRRHSFRNVGNTDVNIERREYLHRKRYHPARYVNDDEEDDAAVDDSGEDYDDGSAEEGSYERPVYHRRRYVHSRGPRHHGYAYGHGRRYVH